MSIFYGVACFLSLILLLVYFFVDKKQNKIIMCLFISVVVCSTGYLILSSFDEKLYEHIYKLPDGRIILSVNEKLELEKGEGIKKISGIFQVTELVNTDIALYLD